jgi:predicted nucleic acid-binding protein
VTVFVDTSALIALLDGDAAEHRAAAATWRSLLQDDEPLIATTYVLVETHALVQRRLGMEAVRVLSRDFIPLLEIAWLDEEVHNAGLAALLTAARRQLSQVDCVSFEVMRRHGVTRAFTFDADFVEQGFDVVPPPSA